MLTEHFVVMVALVALLLAIDFIWNRRFDKLLDRFMAGDYKTYKYFEKKYDNDIKAVEDVRDVEKERLKKVMATMAQEEKEAEEEPDAWDAEEEKLYAQKVAFKPAGEPEKDNEEI